jgi:hypothetical protein
MGAGEVGIRLGGPPRPVQRLPPNQHAPEREERLVDGDPLVIPHTQAAKRTEQAIVRSTTHRHRPRPLPCSERRTPYDDNCRYHNRKSHGRHLPLSDSFSRSGVSVRAAR